MEPRFLSPRSLSGGFDSLEQPTWFVVRTTAYELGKGHPHWLDGVAELRAVYPTRNPFPQETLRVYYYRPEVTPE